jgi:ABC-type multidrug transport system fused ATPase/permease subunit
MRDLRHLFPYLARYRYSFILGLFVIFIRSIIDILQPFFLRLGIDNISTPQTQNTLGFLTLLALLMIGIGIFGFACGFVQRYYINRNAHRIEHDIRRSFYLKMQKLDRSFYDEMSMGELMVRSTVDVSVQRNFINQLFISGAQVLFTGGLALIFMFAQNWKLAAIGLILLPFITISFAVIGDKTHRYFKSGQEQLSELSDRAQEVFVGIRVVKAYNREQAETERYQTENNSYLKALLKYTRLEALLMPIVAMTLSLTTALLLWVGGNEIIAGNLTLGQFVQFNTYLLMLSAPLSNLGQLLNLAQRASASMGRIHEIFVRKPKIKDRGQGTENSENQHPSPITPTRQSSIEFRGVTLQHGDTTVLEDIDLAFEGGKTIAIVGPTGAGKSSLAALLGRVYDPQKGQVLLDGVDVRQVPLQQLREQIVYVPQETLLFSLSLRNNIAFGQEDADDENVLTASELARLSQDLPQIPGGLDALIGERGVTLSGGQKQRTAIARALLPEAKVIILDDALSSVDARTQNLIAENLKRTAQGRTTLIVTQRLSLVKDSDWIVVLNEGKVVEQGIHPMLMAQKGLYARMLEREIAQAEDVFLDEDVPVSAGAGAADSGTDPAIEAKPKKAKVIGDDEEEEVLTRREKRQRKKAEERQDEIDEIVGRDYKGNSLIRLGKYIKRYWKLLLAVIPVLIGAALLDLVGPYLSKIAIDNHILPKEANGLNLIFVLFVATAVGICITRYLRSFLMQMVGQQVVRDLRNDLFSHLLKHSLGFFDKYPAGSLMSRLTSDMDAISDVLSMGGVMIIADILSLAAIIIVMFLLDWQLALVSLAVMPVVLFTTFTFRGVMRSTYRLSRSRYSRLNGYVAESYAGMLIVQLFNRQKTNFEDFETLNDKYLRANWKIVFTNGIFLPLIAFLGILANALLLWWGGWDILNNGHTTIGLLVAFLQYTERAFTPLRDLAERYTIFQAASTSTERIFGLLDQEPAIKDPEKPRKLVVDGRKDWASVQFDKVTFGYNPDYPVIQDMSFEIKAGEKIAIVGATGAGKTSIVSLLGRNYEIQQGVIRIGGTDIREVATADLRSQLALVLQDPVLFKGTIAENIKLGNPDLTDEAMIKAAKQVGAHSFIAKLSGKYNYPLREKGSNLSAGQRQLISFARAIAYNPNAILILDEATSSVDTESEAIIQEALKGLLERRTAIIIAHRLSTIRDVDKVMVIERGKVVEFGSQAELLAQHGLFYQLYRNQMALYRGQGTEVRGQ